MSDDDLNEDLLEKIKAGDLAGTKKCIQKGADLNCHVYGSGTPLGAACTQGSIEIVKVLLEKGAELLADGNWPLLHLAAIKGHVEVGRLLLAKGVPLEAKARKQGGQTALFAAAQFNRPAFVKLLLDAGANATAIDDDGRRPLDFVKRETQAEAKEIAALLEAHGAAAAAPVKIPACKLDVKVLEKAYKTKLPEEYREFISTRKYEDCSGKTFKLPTYRGGAQVYFNRAMAKGKPEVLTLLREADDADQSGLLPFASIYVGDPPGRMEPQFLVIRAGKGDACAVLMFEHEMNKFVPVAGSIRAFLKGMIAAK